MSEPLKIGLIGAGIFAGYHAQKLSHHARVEFTGVFDQNEKRGADLAAEHGVSHLMLNDLLKVSDAVVIASPASTHGRITIQALRAGCHCLIEKPIATTAKEADQIADLAGARDLVVQIGHQERLVLQAIGLDQVEERPVRIEAIRASPYSKRGADTSVTLDLMTHDIDLCSALIKRRPELLIGQSACVRSDRPDMSFAKIGFQGAVAHLEASRVAERSERKMKITYPSGLVEIDFNEKTVSHSTPFALNADFSNDPRAKDSLGEATDIFVQAILDNKPVLVSAYEGAIAAKTAIQIDEFESGET